MKPKYIFLFCLMVPAILALGAVSAADMSDADFNITSTDGDIIAENAQVELVSDVDDELLSNQEDNSFKSLQDDISNATEGLVLKHDYLYNPATDNGPILIDKDNFTVDGDGHTIDADSWTFIFKITGNYVTVKNITFMNGNNDVSGGAIRAYSCLGVENCKFINNTAENGGAIGAFGNCTISNSYFRDNSAEYDGGAVDIEGIGIVENSLFENNSAVKKGGAIFFYDGGEVTNSTFISNSAYWGVICSWKSITVDDSTFIGNIGDYGGAIETYGSTINNSTFENNSANCGAAISSFGPLYISNSIFKGNNAPYDGDIIIDRSLSITLVNVTPNDIVPKYAVTLLLRNVTGTNYGDCVKIAFLVGDDYELFNEGRVYVEIENVTYSANVDNGTAIIEVPGLDIGTYDCLALYDNGEKYSKSPEPVHFEVKPIKTFKELQDEINGAGDVLVLDYDYAYNVSSDNGTIAVGKDNFTIDGAGHTIDADGRTFIFNITGNNVTVRNITFMNGINDLSGGAIRSYNNLAVVNCKFINNTADSGGAITCFGDCIVDNSYFRGNSAIESGGALAFTSIGMVENSLFENNSAALCGGAIYLREGGEVTNSTFISNSGDYGAIFSWENATVNGSTFISNIGSYGGAIFTVGGIINNSYFRDNSVVFSAGAVCIEGFGIVENSVFENNSANRGAAISFIGQLTVINSIFKGNKAPYGGDNIVMARCDNLTLVNVTPNDLVPLYDLSLMLGNVTGTNYGDCVKIAFSVYDEYGPFSEGRVYVEIANVTYSANVDNGTAIIEIPGLNVGVYDCLALYDNENYTQSPEPVHFEVMKRNATISAGSKSYVINYGGKYSVTVNNLASEVNVKFTLNGKTVGTVKTSKGVATITLTSKMLKTAKAGKRNLAISIDNPNYNVAGKTVKITINKEKTKITAKAKTFKRTLKTKKYTIALKNSKGKAMKKVKVYLKVKGKTYTAKTNSKGKATFKITKLTKKGTFKATITYKGNAYYKKATKKVNIKCR